MTRNGSRSALKILHTEFARDPGIRERFLREGYVANRIDHPGRVAILDDDVTEQDEPFLVMELLEGETVQQLWKRKNRRLPPVEALWIASEVLDTLTSFHAEGIVHRDLKPANIFVTKDNVVKLLDFGVARMRDGGGDKTRAGTALGTPSFMAPEQAMGLTDGVDGRQTVHLQDEDDLVVDAVVLKLPVLGLIMRKIAVARFCRTLATLIASGVPILDGLEITARTSGNAIVEDAILATRKSIEGGNTIAAPLKETSVFPSMVVQMISVGETTGALDTMLGKIAEFYEEEVDTAVAGLLTLLEPIMIAFLGVIVGGIVIAMYLPICDLISKLAN